MAIDEKYFYGAYGIDIEKVRTKKMNRKEIKQVEYLNNLKLISLQTFIEKCQMINRQIRDVENGIWYDMILKEQENRSE